MNKTGRGTAACDMKSDNQHLDFLVSQYVDGCLEGANKKAVEQKMLNDPGARQLYAEHRDVQDLLDDWGNRIPMIDWADFDKKLDARLEKEAAEQARVSIFRRRMRPVAAAAALLMAVGLGYGWHAVSHRASMGGGEIANTNVPVITPGKGVQILDMPTNTLASRHKWSVDEPGAKGLAGSSIAVVTIAPPEDSVAVQSLLDTLALGLQNVPNMGPRAGSVSSTSLPVDDRELR